MATPDEIAEALRLSRQLEEERKEAQANIDDGLKSELQLRRDIIAAQTKAIDAIAKNAADQLETSQLLAEKEAEIRDLLRTKGAQIQINKNGARDTLEELQKQTEELQKQLDSLKEMAEKNEMLDKAKIKDGKTFKELLKEAGNDEKKIAEAKEAAQDFNKAALKTQKFMEKTAEKLGKHTGINADYSKTFLGKTEETLVAFGKLKEAGFTFGMLAKGFLKSFFALRNILAAVVKESFNFAVNIEKAALSLGAATGFGDVFKTQVRDIAQDLSLVGVEADDAGAALRSLTDGLSSFNAANKLSNTRVAGTVAQLKLLGVDSAQAVKAIDKFQRTMGMNATQAADATAQLALMGREIGISTPKMITQFNQASGRLAMFGENNIKVFKEMAAMAKATGLEIDTLTKISQKFDQFDTAADSAAKLNAVLGTQLSTIEMMNMTDSERISIMRDQIKASVGNFDSLDKFTKQYIAQAMGVSNVEEAQRLLNMSTSEYQGMLAGQKESADVQKELAAATAELVPTFQKLGLLFTKLFRILDPLTNFFLMLSDGISLAFVELNKLTSGMGATSEGMKIFMTALKALALGVLIYFAPVAASVATVVKVSLTIATALGAIYDVVTKPGSKSMSQGMFSDIGASVLEFAKSVGFALNPVTALAAGVSKLYDSIRPKDEMKFDVTAMAKLNTSKIAAGFTEIKSAVAELSNVKIDGFLAMRTEGAATSFVMGSESVLKNLSEGRIEVDVKIPEIKAPQVNIKVFVDGSEVAARIHKEFKAV